MSLILHRRYGLLRLSTALLAAPTIAVGQESAPQTHADSIALAIAIYTVALSNGTQTAHDAATVEVVCVRGTRPDTDRPPEVIDALQERRTMLHAVDLLIPS